ncbi:MAG: 50S ribosomal protein L32 [Acholeplasmatales bacterium]|nr:50S ribosomal protein L32 [Acholeplasmatales bacterium]
MAVPFRRVSKMKKRMRRSHLALSVPGMITCPSCGELTLAHRVCSNCGYYKGKQVITKKEEAAEEAAK